MLLSVVNSFAQIQTPQTPTFGTKHPVSSSQSYSTGSNYTTGNNAQTITQQRNRQAMQQMGYTPPPTQADIRANLARQRENKQRNIETAQTQKMKMVADILKESYATNKTKSQYFWQSNEYLQALKPYVSVRENLKAMLNGSQPLSLKKALYLLESVDGNNYLTYQQYEDIIHNSVQFIYAWMKENNLDVNDDEALHFALQRFMADTLLLKNTITDGTKSIGAQTGHLPFSYDFIDFNIEKDIKNYHITKTFATGTGQCHTLPLVYLILAEELGIKAWLSYAPIHSFVKYKDKSGTIHNYEATTDWHMSDQSYMDEFYIKSTAIKNHLYLDTVNTQQIIADCLMDLAWFHSRKFGTADGNFINNCIDFAISYFPNRANETAYKLKSAIYANELLDLLSQKNIYNLKEMDKVDGARTIYNKLVASQDKLTNLGYQDLPEAVYIAMLQRHDKKGCWQMANNIQTKTKKNLFFTNNH